jgi:23S rRNA (guanosine2251-2'-O)-methyltransferase
MWRGPGPRATGRQIAIPDAAWEKPGMRKRDHGPRKPRTSRSDFARPDRQDRRQDHRPEQRRRDDRAQRDHDHERSEGAEPRWRRDKLRHDRPSRKKPWRPPARDRDGPVILYGWHSVRAALENPARRFHRLLATENALHRLAETGITLPVAPITADAREIEALVGPDAVHQGILAEADPLDAPAIEDLEPQRLVLVLDQITDPHNVGAILRSAAAFAVEAVITTARHSPEATGVLAKAASAALEHVPLVTVPNLARALDALKDKNVFVVGLDSSGESDLATVPLRAPLALVVGAEGKGLRQLTRSHCDAVARIALPGRIKSLNVSNATALALYVAGGRLAE